MRTYYIERAEHSCCHGAGVYAKDTEAQPLGPLDNLVAEFVEHEDAKDYIEWRNAKEKRND